MVAPAAPLEVKNFDGETVGSESLSLKVADPEVAKGLVHRYLVKVRRDFRKVTLIPTFTPRHCFRVMQVPRLDLKSEEEAVSHFLRKVEVLLVEEALVHRSSEEVE